MERLDTWAVLHPAIVKTLHAFWRHDVRSGVFSGFHAYMYNVRPQTEDIDLFTHPDDFLEVVRLLPEGHLQRNKHVVMHDLAGTVIRFVVDEFTTELDVTPIQVLRPRSPVIIGSEVYDLSMTDLAAANIRPTLAGGMIVNMAHIVDTIATKSLFQRANGKSDVPDVHGLARHCTYEYESYFLDRAVEIGFTDREFSFLGRAGIALDGGIWHTYAAA